jgi:hypothetical protein
LANALHSPNCGKNKQAWTASADASAIIGCKKGRESDAKHGEERRRRVLDGDYRGKTIGGLDAVMRRD